MSIRFPSSTFPGCLLPVDHIRSGGSRILKIFLGYASERLDDALAILEHLRAPGLDEVWFDKDALTGGDVWDAEREAAQDEADLVVHLCSEAILTRKGVVNRELRKTLRNVEDQPFGALYAVFVRLEAMKLPNDFLRFQYIDYFVPDWRERLTRAVDKRRGQLTTEPVIAVGPTEVAMQADAEIGNETLTGPQKIQFSDVTDRYECRGEYLRYDEEGLYWTLVNAQAASHSLTAYFNTRSDFVTIGREGSGLPEPTGAESEFTINCEEFYRSGENVSLRFYTYVYFSGAAHPNHRISTLNFLGEAHGPVAITDLLSNSTDDARKVLDFCEKVITASYPDGEFGEELFFEGYKTEDASVWSLLSQFNFDRRGLTINFSPYDILPYVMGSHEVHVPWSFLADMLNPNYRDAVEDLQAQG